MAELKKKVKSRNGYRLFIRNILRDYKADLPDRGTELTDEGRKRIEKHCRNLKKQASELHNLDKEIIELIDENAIEKEITENLELESEIDEAISVLDSVLAFKQPSNVSTSSQPSRSSSPSNFQRHAKLQKLTLPTFSGKVEDWVSFWDIFESAVHNDPGLPDVTKFQYLQSLLRGPALTAIAGLKVTNANYVNAVEVLHERFGQQQPIISKHVQSLVTLSAVQSCSDLANLRAIYDKTELIVRSLDSIGIKTENYGIFLTTVLMEKLPEELRIMLSRKLGVKSWDLSRMLEIFKEELLVRESCNLMPSNEVKKKFTKNTEWAGRREQPSTTSALYSSESATNSGPVCVFCKGRHLSSRCQTVTNNAARRRILMDTGKCFACFKGGHVAATCESNVKCFNCGARHHVAVCGRKRNTGFDNQSTGKSFLESKEAPANAQSSVTTTSSHFVEQGVRCVLLQTARAKISTPGKAEQSANVRVLLDSGSQKTYISQRVCDRLHLPIVGKEKIQIKTFGNTESTLQECDVVQVCLECPDGLKMFLNGYSVPIICSPITSQHIGFAQSYYPHLRKLPLADFANGDEPLEVDILLGSDYYWSLVIGQPVRGESNRGPTAVKTRLGYVLNGPVDVPNRGRATNSSVNTTHLMKVETVTSFEESLKCEVKKLWDYETLGVKENEPSVYDTFVDQVELKEGRYEVNLPFKDDEISVSDNYSLSEKRLFSLLTKLKCQPQVFSEYDRIITEQFKSGIIERVENVDESEVGKVHYLPHRPVIRMDKSTTKVRVVYDASSHAPGERSLNDNLYAGPPLTPLIFDILLRFRAEKVVLIADIEKAFLNVGVKENERDYLRFLWFDDIKKEHPEIVVYKFRTLVFGLVCSPFLLNGTIRSHLAKYAEQDESFVKNVLESLYVDDYVSSFVSIEEALESYRKLKSVFHAGGFNMRKWDSNSEFLLNEIEKEESGHTERTLKSERENANEKPGFHEEKCKIGCDVTAEEDESFTKSAFKHDSEPQGAKILGLEWDKQSDSLRYDFSGIFGTEERQSISKRDILSLTAQMYDPIGLVSPISLPFKALFQDLCREKVEWDEPLSEDILVTWNASSIKVKGPITINRCVNNLDCDNIETFEIHGFGDASKFAYGAAVYLRTVRKSGESSVQLLTAKTRLAPLKGETIPRLELMAALLLSRLVNSTVEALKSIVKIDRIFCWLDSQIVLWWLFGVNREFQQFVQNRVIEIRKLVTPDKWNYCPTNLNPADIASRGSKATELSDNPLWWTGPDFLKKSPEFWPNILNFRSDQTPSNEIVAEVNKAVKSNPRKDFSDVFVNTVTSSDLNIENIIACENYSNAKHLFRVTAYVIRFVQNLKRRVKGEDCVIGELSLEEFLYAKILWFRQMQNSLKLEKEYQKNRVLLKVFNDEDGLIRCGGRIENANLPFVTKFPIWLPRDHHVTKLLVYEAHGKVGHNGLRETLTELRSTFWIIRGRQIVRSLISKCVICKRLEGLAYNAPSNAPLPNFRVNADFAFSNIGVDFAGPIYVRNIFGSDKTMYKSYIALYTCAVTRAIHLELCPDLSAPAFVRSLKRFQGRRGIPSLTVSDNGKTFKDKKVQRYALENNITWKFNVPRASFWGGFFEVMVKLVKRCLKKIVANAHLTFEELETILIEIESVVNSRPLTFVNSDFDEEPITPSSLVIGRRLLTLPRIENYLEIDDSKTSLTQRQLYLKTLLKHFWSRWSREYLLNLREFHKNKAKNPLRVIKNGDIVVILNDKVKRQNWKLGKIVNVYRGSDQIIRAADVRTVDQSGKPIVLKRSIVHLFPLEVNEESKEVQKEQDNSAKSEDSTDIVIQQVRDEDVVEYIKDRL